MQSRPGFFYRLVTNHSKTACMDSRAAAVVQTDFDLQQDTPFLRQCFENLAFPGIQERRIRIDGSDGRFPVFDLHFPDDRDDIRQFVELSEQIVAARRFCQCEQGPGMDGIQVIEILGPVVEHQQVIRFVGELRPMNSLNGVWLHP